MWREAARLQIHPANFPWEKFSWKKALIHFTRLIGAVNTNNLNEAKTELENLRLLSDKLSKEKNKTQEIAQVAVQIKTSEAWIEYKQGNNEKGLELMKTAADMEDGMEKHPVTPGEVIPARELLAEMLLEMNKPGLAFENFELDLKRHPNRFNGLYGAGIAAQNSGDKEKADMYFKKLMNTADANCKRKELQRVRSFLNSYAARSRSITKN